MSCSVRMTRVRIQATVTVRRADGGIQDVSHERPSTAGLLNGRALVVSIA